MGWGFGGIGKAFAHPRSESKFILLFIVVTILLSPVVGVVLFPGIAGQLATSTSGLSHSCPIAHYPSFCLFLTTHY